MKQRPILVAVIGYIIGILWGLYIRSSIAFCYILILLIYFFMQKFFFVTQKHSFNIISIHRYSRYLKLIVDSKVIFILIIFSIIAEGVVYQQNKIYENTYQNGEALEIEGIIVSQRTERQYDDIYKVKLLHMKQFNILIQVKKGMKELTYGDKIQVKGEYKKPSKQRNYGGYDDSQYLKTQKILGRVKVNDIKVLDQKQQTLILQLANSIKLTIAEVIEKDNQSHKVAMIKGLLLGDTQEIEEEVKEDFRITNISHILAISGMHVGYIIVALELIFKQVVGKRTTSIITIIVLVFYSFLTGFSPSIIRAVVASILNIVSHLFYRKSDRWNDSAISLLAILLYNPFLLFNIGLQLSYLGTIGIILFQPTISQILYILQKDKPSKVRKKVNEMIAVSLSAQIMLLPLLVYHFHTLGIYVLITNLLVSVVIGPIIVLGFLYVIFSFVGEPMTKLIVFLLNGGLDILKGIAKFSELPLAKIYLSTPKILYIVLYWLGICLVNQVYPIYYLRFLTTTQQRIKNLISLFYYQYCQKRTLYFRVMIFIIFIFFLIFFTFPKNLSIHFVDVGQGDCTFIVTPQNKSILIDGGGSLSEEFDVGKKILIPYLLDRGYTTIDYVMVSHFDQDHVRFYPIFITRNKSKQCGHRKAI